MSRQQAATILAAADRWKQRCLLDSGSLFSDERLWTGRNFDQLRIHFVENPDEGSEPFYEKLRRQLGPATPEAKRLWSEMTWAFYLIVRDVNPNTKRDRIAMVWEWSGARLPEEHWALDDDVLTGCANLGPGRAQQWRELRFIVLTMNDWFSLSRQEREALTGDAWKFAGWLADRRLVQGRQFRHALLFLLFPDSFEPIVVGSRKREIVKGSLGTRIHQSLVMMSPSTDCCWRLASGSRPIIRMRPSSTSFSPRSWRSGERTVRRRRRKVTTKRGFGGVSGRLAGG